MFALAVLCLRDLERQPLELPGPVLQLRRALGHFHLQGLIQVAQGLLALFAVVDVEYDAAGADGAPVGIPAVELDLSFDQDPADGAVRPDDAVFVLEDAGAGWIAGGVQGLLQLPGIVRMDEAWDPAQRRGNRHVGGQAQNLPHLGRAIHTVGHQIGIIDAEVGCLCRLSQPLFALAHRLLGPLALGDVDVDAGHAQGVAGLVSEDLPASGHPMDASVGPNHAPFPLCGCARFEGSRHSALRLLPIFGMDKLLPRLLSAAEAARRQAVHRFQLRRPSVHTGLNVPFECADARRLLGQPQPLFALAQGLFGLFALGDVQIDPCPGDDPALFIPYRPANRQHMTVVAFFRSETVFLLERFTGRDAAKPMLSCRLDIFRGQQVQPAELLDLLHRYPDEFQERVADIGAVAARIGEPDSVRDRLPDGAVSLLTFAQRLLGPLALRVVEDVALDFVQLALLVEMADEVLDDVDRLAVPAFPPDFKTVDLPLLLQSLQKCFPLLGIEVEIQHARPDRLLGPGEPERSGERRITQQDLPLGRADEIPRQVVLEETVVTLLAFAQALFGTFALGDVMDHADGAGDPAGVVAEVFALLMHEPNFAGVPADDAVLDLVGVAVLAQRAGVGGVHRRAVLRVYAVEKRLVGRAEFLRCQAEHAIDLVRPGQLIPGQVQLPTAQMCDLLRMFQPFPALAQRLCSLLALGDVPPIQIDVVLRRNRSE